MPSNWIENKAEGEDWLVVAAFRKRARVTKFGVDLSLYEL